MTTTEQTPDVLQPVIDAVAQAMAVDYYRQATGNMRHAETPEQAAAWWNALDPNERKDWRHDGRVAVLAAVPALADAWERGMVAAKLAAAGIKPARNPYRPAQDGVTG